MRTHEPRALIADGSVDELVLLVSTASDTPAFFDAIEAARSRVRPDGVARLAGAYDRLTSWLQRGALVALLQDHLAAGSRQLMRDFLLRSPPDAAGSDLMHAGRVIALCHLEGNLDAFEAYDSVLAVEAGRARWQREQDA